MTGPIHGLPSGRYAYRHNGDGTTTVFRAVPATAVRFILERAMPTGDVVALRDATEVLAVETFLADLLGTQGGAS